VTTVSCGKEKLIVSACRDDAACGEGELCDDFQCVPAAAKACENVVDGNPILQPDPYAVNFGDLDLTHVDSAITLHNIGNCTLTLFEASLGKGSKSVFGSDLLNSSFPIEIFPGRSQTFPIFFDSSTVGVASDELNVLSDDKEFPELRIPLRANYLGAPKVRVTPNPIDFGYVAQGRQGLKNVQVVNVGTGVAPVSIDSIELSDPTSQDFSFTEAFMGPRSLKPVTLDNTAIIPMELHYTPRSTAKHAMELVVKTSKGEIRVPIAGNAETPPKMTLNPTSIDLGDVPLGTTNLATLTITNEGGADLAVSLAWGGAKPNTDLFTTPTVVPAVKGGAFVEVQVGFTATALGPATGLLNITSNDPSKPSVTIPVTANGIAGAGGQVVKLEMVFENGTDGIFDNDVRNVDMTLEHPFGYICNKGTPNPTNWGLFGKPTWLAFAPKEEPERIVLADAQSNGTYRVMLQYIESCKSLPTGLLASILGISADILITYLTGGAVPVNGQDISKMVEQMCLSHGSSAATVRVYVDGALIKEKTVTLGKKGDSLYAVDLIRSTNGFTAQ
jgi:hypothetical protein